MPFKLDLQFFAEETPAAPESDNSWESFLSEQLSNAEVVDEQPETDSETEAEESAEVTAEEGEETAEQAEEEQQEETDEEQQENEEQDEKPALDDDTLIDMGEGRQPLTLKELKNGYLRQSDYTKKTQKLAEERKAFEAEKQQYEPVKQWLDFIQANPYLFQQINQAIEQWQNTGVLPLDEVINTEAGPYINHLMRENARLQQELDQLKGEYQSTKFNSEFSALILELKGEYGDLITPEYEEELRKQAEEYGYPADVMKKIAKADLAEKKLAQVQKESKKAEAKAKQKLREQKLPPQPKQVAQKPAPQEIDLNASWEDLAKLLARK
ncbi:hypothetical protein [Geobacillus sp. BMUD]|uniref:hypothetical protein n=1 Tax=Geobacillus sp. BMUD TaxID=2508876 RepID=UPI00149232F0|nr:hypothetical protein [Geobacillus sp. BMUD]